MSLWYGIALQNKRGIFYLPSDLTEWISLEHSHKTGRPLLMFDSASDAEFYWNCLGHSQRPYYGKNDQIIYPSQGDDRRQPEEPEGK